MVLLRIVNDLSLLQIYRILDKIVQRMNAGKWLLYVDWAIYLCCLMFKNEL